MLPSMLPQGPAVFVRRHRGLAPAWAPMRQDKTAATICRFEPEPEGFSVLAHCKRVTAWLARACSG